MDKKDIKEKIIILGVMAGIFLPVRLFVSMYISDHWLGSVGLVSAFAVLLLVLIKKKKLGWFGKIFEKQMKKTIGGKTGKYILAIAILFLIYFGGTLFFIERGSTVYLEDVKIFSEAISKNGKFGLNDLPMEKLTGPHSSLENELSNLISNLEYTFSVVYSVMNEKTDGWLGHLLVISVVEQIEVMGMLALYRKVYTPISFVKP